MSGVVEPPCAAATAARRDSMLSGWRACPPGGCAKEDETRATCACCTVVEVIYSPEAQAIVAESVGNAARPAFVRRLMSARVVTMDGGASPLSGSAGQ